MIEIVVGLLAYFAFTDGKLEFAVSVNDYRVAVCLNQTAKKNDVENDVEKND
jgi:hypothetical protein